MLLPEATASKFVAESVTEPPGALIGALTFKLPVVRASPYVSADRLRVALAGRFRGVSTQMLPLNLVLKFLKPLDERLLMSMAIWVRLSTLSKLSGAKSSNKSPMAGALPTRRVATASPSLA